MVQTKGDEGRLTSEFRGLVRKDDKEDTPYLGRRRSRETRREISESFPSRLRDGRERNRFVYREREDEGGREGRDRGWTEEREEKRDRERKREEERGRKLRGIGDTRLGKGMTKSIVRKITTFWRNYRYTIELI